MAWEVVDTLRGTNGVDGTDGTDGSPGSSGADGNTVLYGASDPANGTGVNGNFYINTTAHTLFGPKASGTWPSGTSLIGPQGIQGIQGVAGNNGSNGTNGTNGADGNTILYGTGAPSNGLGTNGNFYIATNTNTIYGPKASGTWPAGTSLIGPQGPAGADGGAADVAAVTHAATGKTTPVDADELPIVDSAASNVLKKLTWANLKAALLGTPTGTGTATWPALAASGLTGSTTTTRLVGANASGAPSTGAHNLYDVAVDGTGKLWICTTAGTPGTWTQVGGSSSSAFSGCSVQASGSLPVANGYTTKTAVPLPSELFDTDGYHSTTTNTERFTIPSGKAGYFRVVYTPVWAQNATADRRGFVYKNGTSQVYANTWNAGNSETAYSVDLPAIYLAVSDSVELRVEQASGGSLNLNWCWGYLIRLGD